MKLCIVKPDGNMTEVLMSERPPLLATVNNKLLFFENYQYKLIIRDNEADNNVELFVGDYLIPLHYNYATNCFETEMELIFEGCFDLAYISVCVGDGEEKIFYTDFFRIATTKQTAKQVGQMFDEIEENLPGFLEICFSRNRKSSGIIKNVIDYIENQITGFNKEITALYNFLLFLTKNIQPLSFIV